MIWMSVATGGGSGAGFCEYSGEDDRRFRPNVTGDSARSALLWFFTLVGHDQSTSVRRRAFLHGAGLGEHFRDARPSAVCRVSGRSAVLRRRGSMHHLAPFLVRALANSSSASAFRIDSLVSRWIRCDRCRILSKIASAKVGSPM